jgi:hypothetical protein
MGTVPAAATKNYVRIQTLEARRVDRGAGERRGFGVAIAGLGLSPRAPDGAPGIERRFTGIFMRVMAWN